ncbi:MAG: c-type cytochrome [Acidobacteria bacterium]|nr:c-type cytochrome [Acidobacteriota bacterium]NIM61777.1 c-type cytochrome [Acidobacteriota bacterium]NIO60021.1 c-type cytochrome [Acidobacteriota bacterium]NIQ29213.1 c-type cytochrome [Acidobacteriota bacterium]NIQ83787.1 c-type cytochrome [Acidobacteriota bacterium]
MRTPGMIGGSCIWMAQQTRIDRLPRWLDTARPQETADRSLGPRERLLIAAAVLVILIWGFDGWEYPETEFVAGGSGSGALSTTAGSLGTQVPDAGVGAELFQANGCYACHSLDGERIIGPSLLGIYGTTVELDDGSVVPIDDAYLVESILQPEAKRVAGYADAAMPSYEGLVTREDAEALAEYIKGLQ